MIHNSLAGRLDGGQFTGNLYFGYGSRFDQNGENEENPNWKKLIYSDHQVIYICDDCIEKKLKFIEFYKKSIKIEKM
jgi:hypothetical protein